MAHGRTRAHRIKAQTLECTRAGAGTETSNMAAHELRAADNEVLLACTTQSSVRPPRHVRHRSCPTTCSSHGVESSSRRSTEGQSVRESQRVRPCSTAYMPRPSPSGCYRPPRMSARMRHSPRPSFSSLHFIFFFRPLKLCYRNTLRTPPHTDSASPLVAPHTDSASPLFGLLPQTERVREPERELY